MSARPWLCACCNASHRPNNPVVSFKLRNGLLILCMTCWHDMAGHFLDAVDGESSSRGMH